jgi:hypothetical protein
MSSQIERAANMLFPDGEPTFTRNIKFLCAGVSHMSAESLAEQIVRAEVQIRSGNARLVTDVDAHLTPSS